MISLAKFQSLNTRLPISHYCLDSASDNYSTHHLAYSLGIIPIIDINKRAYGHNVYEPCKGISENGRPIWLNNEEMICHGNDYTRQRHKFRCPHCYKKSILALLSSRSSYGWVVYLKFDTDIKLFDPVPYKSDKWKDIYIDRTSCERINTIIINDYQFKDIRVHARKRNLFFLIMIGINIHLDAYYKIYIN